MRGFALVFTVGVVGMGCWMKRSWVWVCCWCVRRMPGLDDTISPSSSSSIGCHPLPLLDRVLACSTADSYPQTRIFD
jgi:hypothetical protein